MKMEGRVPGAVEMMCTDEERKKSEEKGEEEKGEEDK